MSDKAFNYMQALQQGAPPEDLARYLAETRGYDLDAFMADGGDYGTFIVEASHQPKRNNVEEPDGERGWMQWAGDTALSVGSGVTQLGEMVTGGIGGAGSPLPGMQIPGVGNVLAEKFREAGDYLRDARSDYADQNLAEAQATRDAAEGTGWVNELVAGGASFFDAPWEIGGELLGQAAGTGGLGALARTGATKLATAAGANATKAGVIGTRVGVGTMLGTGAAQGAGEVKANIMQAVFDEMVKAGVDEETAAKAADAAQAWGGDNTDMQIVGTLLGGIAGVTGLEPALAGKVVRNALTKGIGKEAAEEAIQQTQRGLMRRMAAGAAKEAIPEAVQAGQAAFAGNLAAQREGFDVDLSKGVFTSAGMEGVAGGMLGATIGRERNPPDAKAKDRREREIADIPDQVTSETEGELQDADFQAAVQEILDRGTIVEREEAVIAARRQFASDRPADTEPDTSGAQPGPRDDSAEPTLREPASEAPVGDSVADSSRPDDTELPDAEPDTARTPEPDGSPLGASTDVVSPDDAGTVGSRDTLETAPEPAPEIDETVTPEKLQESVRQVQEVQQAQQIELDDTEVVEVAKRTLERPAPIEETIEQVRDNRVPDPQLTLDFETSRPQPTEVAPEPEVVPTRDFGTTDVTRKAVDRAVDEVKQVSPVKPIRRAQTKKEAKELASLAADKIEKADETGTVIVRPAQVETAAKILRTTDVTPEEAIQQAITNGPVYSSQREALDDANFYVYDADITPELDVFQDLPKARLKEAAKTAVKNNVPVVDVLREMREGLDIPATVEPAIPDAPPAPDPVTLKNAEPPVAMQGILDAIAAKPNLKNKELYSVDYDPKGKNPYILKGPSPRGTGRQIQIERATSPEAIVQRINALGDDVTIMGPSGMNQRTGTRGGKGSRGATESGAAYTGPALTPTQREQAALTNRINELREAGDLNDRQAATLINNLRNKALDAAQQAYDERPNRQNAQAVKRAEEMSDAYLQDAIPRVRKQLQLQVGVQRAGLAPKADTKLTTQRMGTLVGEPGAEQRQMERAAEDRETQAFESMEAKVFPGEGLEVALVEAFRAANQKAADEGGWALVPAEELSTVRDHEQTRFIDRTRAKLFGLRPTGTVSAPRARAAINKAMAAWPTPLNVEVVETALDLPPTEIRRLKEDGIAASDLPRLKGFVSRDGKVTIIARNLGSEAEATGVLYHEVLGHLGLLGYLRNTLDSVMQEMYNKNPRIRREAKKFLKLYKGDPNPEARAVEEVFAAWSERGIVKPSLFRKIKAAIDKFLREVGLRKTISDAEAMELLYNAHRNYLNNPDTMPVAVNHSRFNFVGEGSGYDAGGLRDAKALLDDGLTPEQVWKDTGWLYGKDGKWRIMLSPTEREAQASSALKNFLRSFSGTDGKLGQQTFRLGYILKYPKLFELYPGLADVQVMVTDAFDKDTLGSFSYDRKGQPIIRMSSDAVGFFEFAEDRIELSDKDKITKPNPASVELGFMSVLLHEVQHYIQNVEGMSQGGSMESNYLITYANMLDLGDALRAVGDTQTAEIVQDFTDRAIEHPDVMEAYNAFEQDRLSERDFSAAEAKLTKKFRDEFERLVEEAPIDVNMEAVREMLYHRLEGEVEAFEVSNQYIARQLPDYAQMAEKIDASRPYGSLPAFLVSRRIARIEKMGPAMAANMAANTKRTKANIAAGQLGTALDQTKAGLRNYDPTTIVDLFRTNGRDPKSWLDTMKDSAANKLSWLTRVSMNIIWPTGGVVDYGESIWRRIFDQDTTMVKLRERAENDGVPLNEKLYRNGPFREIYNLLREAEADRNNTNQRNAAKARTLQAWLRKPKNKEALFLAQGVIRRVQTTGRILRGTLQQAYDNDYILQQREAALRAEPKSAAKKGLVTRRKNQLKQAYDSYQLLMNREGGEDMYNMIRDFHMDHAEQMQQATEARIKDLPLPEKLRAEFLQQIRAQEQEAIREFYKEQEAEDYGEEGASMYDDIDMTKMPVDYVPFMRFGNHVLVVENKDAGIKRQVHFFDTERELKRFREGRAKDMGVDPKDARVFQPMGLDEYLQDSKQYTPDLTTAMGTLAKRVESMDLGGGDQAVQERIRREMAEIMLQAAPVTSLRRRMMKFKGRPGESDDVLRNFTQSGVAYANTLSRLKYTHRMNNELDSARDALTDLHKEDRDDSIFVNGDDVHKMHAVIGTMQKQIESSTEPPSDSYLVTNLNRVAYLWLLSGAATAAIQLTSIPMFTYPRLAVQFGVGKATAALTRHANLFDHTGWLRKKEDGSTAFAENRFEDTPTYKKSAVIRAVYDRLNKRDTIMGTPIQEILRNEESPTTVTGTAKEAAAGSIFRALTGLFNASEVVSRRVVMAATAELAYEKAIADGLTPEAAVEAAADASFDVLEETIGDYSNANRANWLKGPLGKLVGLFKMYSILRTRFFFGALRTLMTGQGKQTRADAFKELSGVLFMSSMFHGFVGMPFYGTMAAIITKMADEFGDDDEEPANPIIDGDPELKFRYYYLDKWLGEPTIPGLDGRDHRLSDIIANGPLTELTDINIGSRTEFRNLWMRPAIPEDKWSDSFMMAVAGNIPGVSLLAGFADGAQQMIEAPEIGDAKFMRGLERMVPALARGSLQLKRIDMEGGDLRTRNNQIILTDDEISGGNKLAQALGFQSTRYSQVRDFGFKAKALVDEVSTARSDLHQQFNHIMERGEGPEALQQWLQRVRKHNDKYYPLVEFMVTPDSVERSYKSRMSRQDGRQMRGIVLNDKDIPVIQGLYEAARPE